MASSPVPTWAREMSPHHRGPTAGGVLLLAALVVLVMLALSAIPTAQSGAQPVGRDRSLCEEHRGEPGWAGVCQRR